MLKTVSLLGEAAARVNLNPKRNDHRNEGPYLVPLTSQAHAGDPGLVGRIMDPALRGFLWRAFRWVEEQFEQGVVEKLLTLGATQLEHLDHLEEEDLDELNLPRVPRRALQRALQAWKQMEAEAKRRKPPVVNAKGATGASSASRPRGHTNKGPGRSAAGKQNPFSRASNKQQLRRQKPAKSPPVLPPHAAAGMLQAGANGNCMVENRRPAAEL